MGDKEELEKAARRSLSVKENHVSIEEEGKTVSKEEAETIYRAVLPAGREFREPGEGTAECSRGWGWTLSPGDKSAPVARSPPAGRDPGRGLMRLASVTLK